MNTGEKNGTVGDFRTERPPVAALGVRISGSRKLRNEVKTFRPTTPGTDELKHKSSLTFVSAPDFDLLRPNNSTDRPRAISNRIFALSYEQYQTSPKSNLSLSVNEKPAVSGIGFFFCSGSPGRRFFPNEYRVDAR